MKFAWYFAPVIVTAMLITLSTAVFASLASKTWPGSDEAKQLVKETILIGMMASPYAIGWTMNEQLLEHYRESREAGITGHEITLTAASMNWDHLTQAAQGINGEIRYPIVSLS